MNILFLVENAENLTARYLIEAFNEFEHSVDVIPYYSNGVNQCAIVTGIQGESLCYNGNLYSPQDYDAALLWSWGTAELGRQYLRFFEDRGVAVMNSSYDTEITDSKLKMHKRFQSQHIQTPTSMLMNTSMPVDHTTITRSLGSAPYVLKSDYSTQGQGIRFIRSIEELQVAITDLYTSQGQHSDYLLQAFMGNANLPISHYRALVIGDQVYHKGIKMTAPDPMACSNMANGSSAEIIDVNPSLRATALAAAHASGLKIAGVDLMQKYPGIPGEYTVLEVNDGPGTKTFERYGHSISLELIRFFLNHVANDQRVAAYDQPILNKQFFNKPFLNNRLSVEPAEVATIPGF